MQQKSCACNSIAIDNFNFRCRDYRTIQIGTEYIGKINNKIVKYATKRDLRKI